MAYIWLPEEAKCFWQSRNIYSVFHYSDLDEKIRNYTTSMANRKEREELEKNDYFAKHTFLPIPQSATQVNQITKLSADIRFWAKYNSWTFCSTCNSLSSKILSYNFSKRPKNDNTTKCVRLQSRYIVPLYKNMPTCLLSLTVHDINILRPFYIFLEEYERSAHGYRVKCCPIKLRISEKSPQAKIEVLTDPIQNKRCENAYNYLMMSNLSTYSHFVQLRERKVAENNSLNLFNFKETEGIECALWPNLYRYTSWCESVVSDSGSRLSAKLAFNAKLLSEVVDYAQHFELLQFQYDLWLYKTVTGAINTARYAKCLPARSLDSKTFSATYWEWQHRYVLDAVDQFGLPDIFITISPFEWSFPFPKWLEEIRLKTGKGPTELAGYETTHIVHVLAQIVRGYLCGSNSSKWSKHIFSYNRLSTQSNVKTYFYRFEFQKRGTVICTCWFG